MTRNVYRDLRRASQSRAGGAISQLFFKINIELSNNIATVGDPNGRKILPGGYREGIV